TSAAPYSSAAGRNQASSCRLRPETVQWSQNGCSGRGQGTGRLPPRRRLSVAAARGRWRSASRQARHAWQAYDVQALSIYNTYEENNPHSNQDEIACGKGNQSMNHVVVGQVNCRVGEPEADIYPGRIQD